MDEPVIKPQCLPACLNCFCPGTHCTPGPDLATCTTRGKWGKPGNIILLDTPQLCPWSSMVSSSMDFIVHCIHTVLLICSLAIVGVGWVPLTKKDGQKRPYWLCQTKCIVQESTHSHFDRCKGAFKTYSHEHTCIQYYMSIHQQTEEPFWLLKK